MSENLEVGVAEVGAIRRRDFRSRLLTFSLLLALAIARAPQLLWLPRFWAEEATFYFLYAYEHDWLSGLLLVPHPYATYLSLAANLPAVVAAQLLPLESAPFATTYVSFAILLLALALVCFGSSRVWDSAGRRVLAGAVILLSPTATPEAWLNSINAMVYCGLISVILLLEKLDPPGSLPRWRRCGKRALLLFCGLSGVYTVALAPLYLARYLVERGRENAARLVIVVFTSVVQVSLYLYFQLLAPASASAAELLAAAPRPGFEWSKAAVYALYYHVAAPLVGVRSMRSVLFPIGDAPALPYFLHELSWGTGLALGGVAALTLVAVVWGLLGGGRRVERWLLVGAFLSTSLLVCVVSLGGVPGGRYAMLPGFLLAFCLIDLSRCENPSWPRRLALGLLLLLLGVGSALYRDGDYLRYAPGTPLWSEEVRAWRENPDRALSVWPYPRWRLLLPSRELRGRARERLASAGGSELDCSKRVQRHRIPLEGLPVYFDLEFELRVVGSESARVELLFEGDRGRALNRYVLVIDPTAADEARRVRLHSLDPAFRGAWGEEYFYHEVRALVLQCEGSPARVRAALSPLRLDAQPPGLRPLLR